MKMKVTGDILFLSQVTVNFRSAALKNNCPCLGENLADGDVEEPIPIRVRISKFFNSSFSIFIR